MPKLLRCLLFGILSWSLTDCAHAPPDVFVFEALDQHLSTDPASGHLILKGSPTCIEKLRELSCGHGVKIVSGEEIWVGDLPEHRFNGKTWSDLKDESVIVPAVESYAPLKTYVVDSCKQMNCNDQVDAFKVKLNSLNGISGVIGPKIP